MEEFATTLWEELDYESEADNAERFAEIFAGDDKVRIPAVYRSHSTRRVLVLEDVSSIKITDVESMVASNIDPKQVALLVMDTYFHQIFKVGFFHADPHPGNLFVHPLELDPGRTDDEVSRSFRLVFVDFGMVGQIQHLMGENLRRVLVSVTQRDAKGLTEAYNDLGFFLPGSDLERITEAQEKILDHLWGRNLLELSQPDPREMRELGEEFRDLLFDFPFQVPQDFIFLGRAMGMLSGLVSLLDPTINPWGLVEQYGREIIRSQEAWQTGLDALRKWLGLFITLPMQMQRVLNAAEKGELKVQGKVDRQTLRRLERLERRANRPNWGVVMAAAVISGTLFYLNEEIPLAALSWGFATLFFLLMLIRRE